MPEDFLEKKQQKSCLERKHQEGSFLSPAAEWRAGIHGQAWEANLVCSVSHSFQRETAGTFSHRFNMQVDPATGTI